MGIKVGSTSIGDAMHDKWRINLDNVLGQRMLDMERMTNDIARAKQEREAHRRRAEEATIELSAQTKEQNRLLRELLAKKGGVQSSSEESVYQHMMFSFPMLTQIRVSLLMRWKRR